MAAFQRLALMCTLSSPASVLSSRATDVDFAPNLPSFTSFIATHSRTYSRDAKEYDMRRGLYEHRLKQAQHHNSQPRRLWDATVNHLTDRTDSELSQLRGLRSVQSSKKTGRSAGIVATHRGGQFLGQIRNTVIPAEKSWAHLKGVKLDFDQGACGSCWAIATATAMWANAEIQGHNRTFSAQELVDCVQNPHNCGGSGGCQGATVELGMNWIMEQGLDTQADTPYRGSDQKCKKNSATSLISNNGDTAALEEMVAVGYHAAKSKSSPGLLLGLNGWERLPQNEYEPLMKAVALTGPAAVSVAANGWNAYGAGIYDDCDKDATIDHAVTLIGYGTDTKRNQKYWTLKNSWGLSWGEDGGTIRLLRHEGNIHCGTDYQPKVGTGCDDGPSSVPVCGMCGILYDAVVPHFGKSN